LSNHQWESAFPLGTADATGEKTRFQAKNAFFHSGVSFFSLVNSCVFPLKIGKGAAQCSPIAGESGINTAPAHDISLERRAFFAAALPKFCMLAA